MKFRNKLLLRYAKKMGFLQTEEIENILIYQTTIEDYLLQIKKISMYRFDKVRLLFLNHCILLVLKKQDFFSSQVCEQLLREQKEILIKKPSFELDFMLLEHVDSKVIEKIAQKLYQQKIITSQDFNFLQYMLKKHLQNPQVNPYEATYIINKNDQIRDDFDIPSLDEELLDDDLFGKTHQ